MRIAVFIDGPGLHQLETRISQKKHYTDFMLLKDYVSTLGTPSILNYYALTSKGADGFSRSKKYLDWMEFNGYNIITKQAEQGTVDTTGAFSVKITTDAMLAARTVDMVLLLTGNGVFVDTVKAIRQMGCLCGVIGTEIQDNTAPGISEDLRRAANYYYPYLSIQKLRVDAMSLVQKQLG